MAAGTVNLRVQYPNAKSLTNSPSHRCARFIETSRTVKHPEIAVVRAHFGSHRAAVVRALKILQSL